MGIRIILSIHKIKCVGMLSFILFLSTGFFLFSLFFYPLTLLLTIVYYFGLNIYPVIPGKGLINNYILLLNVNLLCIAVDKLNILILQ